MPAQISTSASLNVTVEVPAANGQFAPAPNMLVDFTPTCATVNPTSGRTNASGVISTTVTPNAGCSSVSVDAVARADVGTTPLAQKIVTAAVTGFVFEGNLSVDGFDPLGQLAGLVEVTGNLRTVSGNGLGGDVHLPSLRRVGGEIDVRKTLGLTSVRLPALESVGTDIVVLETPALSHFEVPSLRQARTLLFSGNRALTNVTVGPAVLSSEPGRGDLIISNNAAITNLSGFNSGLVVGSLSIQNNAALSTLEAFNLASRITVRGGTTISGNTGQ